MSLRIEHVIRVLDETVDQLAPKHVGTSVKLSATRNKLRGLIRDLEHQREQLTQERMEQADIAAYEEASLRG